MLNEKNEIIKELMSSQDFVDVFDKEKNKVVVVDFYAPWCGPCLRLGEFLNKLLLTDSAKANYKNVLFYKVNIDNEKCVELVDKFEVTSIPRVIMLKNKIVECDMTGFNPKELVNNLNKLVLNKTNTNQA